MNIHEQCLLRYLKYPDELSCNTDILKLHNKILEEKFVMRNILAEFQQFNYTEVVK